MPNTAPLVAAELRAHRAGAMDVGAACTGFLYAVAMATAQIEAGRAQQVLVIGADRLSGWLDPDDRRTAALFGDGAGAVLMSAAEAPGRVGPTILRADGARAESIIAHREDSILRMEGHDTFKHAVLRLAEVTQQATEAARLGLEDIDLFVYHQANRRILRSVGQRLGLDFDRVVDCVERYGNTSAASIPIALAEATADGRLRDGARVLLAAFGSGFTWGGVVVEWGRHA
jgi:3-oxoacyl-[acyl-carrier-protein] synthase-3